MVLFLTAVTGAFAALAGIGAAQSLAGWLTVVRFIHAMRNETDFRPPITVLKPLHGEEPMLAEALATLCEQSYPAEFQVVFGVSDEADTAIPVVRALQARYPARDLLLVVNATRHGSNPKIGNLINMLPAARHATIVIADSDVHARPDYLRRLADALERPNVGLVSTLYTGLPAFRTVVSSLGATQITHGFLPGALLARALGRRDCLGATMCLTRETLARIGGLEALRDYLADDNMLGRFVRAEGLDVVLADTVVATTVPERRLSALWRHELRWARTIRSMEPMGYFLSVAQYPLYWALLAVVASGGAGWTLALAIGIWAIRAISVMGVGRALGATTGGLAFRAPVWLLPLRDLLSAAEWIVSHGGRRVDWRGQTLEADTLRPPVPPPGVTSVASEGYITKGSHA
jgi:ceramide glucosyltransferase